MFIRDVRSRMLIYILGCAIYLISALFAEYYAGSLASMSIYYMIFLSILGIFMITTCVYIIISLKNHKVKLLLDMFAIITGAYLLCTYFIFGFEYIVLLFGGMLLLVDGVLDLNEKKF